MDFGNIFFFNTMQTKGCVHIHIKDGRFRSVFSHLSNFPKNCVIHLKPETELTKENFIKTHPSDIEELKAKGGKVFNLGDRCYTHKE
jgi:aspartyl-tRNA synthetase